jgi:histidinol-phosphate aminotransferase
MDAEEFIEKKLPSLARSCFKTLKAYTPGEQPQDVDQWIKLNTNENPFEPLESIINQLQEAIQKRMRMYPDPTAKALKAAIAQNFLSQYKTIQQPENILIANGSDETLDILFKTFVDPGDGVVYFDPSYGMYSVLTETYCGISRVFPLDPETFTVGKVDFQPKDKLLIICSPNNPDGNTVSLQIIEYFCQRFPGIVFIDEAYGDFADNTALTLLPKYPNLIVGKTYSKSSSLASVRLGFAIADEHIIQLFDTVRLPYNVSYLTQVAGIATMECWTEIQQRVEQIKSERKRVIQALTELGYDILPSQSNFYLVRYSNPTSASVAYNRLKEMKILVRYWAKPNLGKFMRVTVGTPTQNDAFIDAMKKIK